METEKPLEQTLSYLPVGIGIFRLQDKLIYPLFVNETVCAYLGVSYDDYQQRIANNETIVTINEITASLTSTEIDISTAFSKKFEVKTTRSDGAVIYLKIIANKMVASENGSMIYAVIEDITLDKQKAVRQDWINERYRILNDLTHAISYDYDSELDTLYYYLDPENQGQVQEFVLKDYVKKYLKSPASAVDPSSQAYFDSFAQAAAGKIHGVAIYRADYFKTGYRNYQTEWFRIVPETGGPYHLIGLVIDIEDKILLKHEAEFDSLTNVHNRATTEKWINTILSSKEQTEGDMAIIVDIDNFKLINDSLGHIRGDRLLHDFGKMLLDSCRPSDWAGRIGGDEFFLCYRGLSLKETVERLQKIEKKCQMLSTGFTLSMGVYILNGRENDYLEIVDKADRALYRAKRNGKNRIEIYDYMRDYEFQKDIIKESMAETEYGLLINSVGVSVSKHLMDEHYTLVWANQRYYEMFGYSKDEYEEKYHNHCDLFFKSDPETWKSLVETVQKMLADHRRKYEFVCRMPHRNGKKLWIKLIGNLTDEQVNGVNISYSVMMDITEQMQLEKEHAITYESIPGLIAKYKVTEAGFTLLDANQKYYENFRGKKTFSFEELTVESGLDKLLEIYPQMRQGEPVDYIFSPRDRTGKIIHMHVKGICSDYENGDPIYLLIYEDITLLTEQHRILEKNNLELEKLAYADEVTAGINRFKFEQLAGNYLRLKPPGYYAIVWLNVDKFKVINDMAGEEGGNRSLKYIYEVISRNIRPDELVCRTSADNFTLLLQVETKAVMSQRLETIARKINSFNKDDSYKYIFTFTAGIYIISGLNRTLTQMQDRANIARKMIEKTDSSVQCTCRFYSEKERKKLIFEKEIENKMDEALQTGRFKVYLQPKYAVATDRIAGAEALVRWLDPDRGLIPPGQFIPIFEQNGFIVKLDFYVFETVCRQLKKWQDEGRKLYPISINVSRVHFSSVDFVEQYAQICQKYEISPSWLEIEVTETVAFDNPDKFAQIVQAFHQLGFSCSIDDFGSGYSSLNILKDIDVDVLKLDKAFFSSPHMNDHKERDIVSAIIQLAKTLKIKTVAEGIETENQRDFLKTTACDLIQGYIYSRPLPLEDFEKTVFAHIQ